MDTKVLIIVLDGAADRPSEVLGGSTPLSFAHTPNLDSIAKLGITGMLDIIGDNRVPVSSSGAMSILGYDVNKYYPGDAMLEALGVEYNPIREGDVVIHASFASGDGKKQIMDRRVCRDLSDAEAKQLAHDITQNVKLFTTPAQLRLYNYRYYRNVLILNRTDGRVLSDQISNTDPAHTKDGYFDIPNKRYEMRVLPCQPLADTDEARATAALVNEFIEKTNTYLSNHPVNLHRRAISKPLANLIITRNASGKIPRIPPFDGSLGMIVEMPAEYALGKIIGAKHIYHSFLAEPTISFYEELATNVLTLLEKVDILYIHTKGPDEPGHDGDPLKKAQVLEMIDNIFLKSILSKLSLETISLVVTCDHATPCELRVHSADPVPICILKPQWHPDKVDKFSELHCQNGALGTIPGKELLSLLRNR